MGNNKSALRKAQSVPDTQNLPADAPVLVKAKSQSTQKLNQPPSKSGKVGKGGKKSKHRQEEAQEFRLPPAEAVFLPDFPLRGNLEDLDFEVIDVIAKGAYGNVIKVQREDQKRFYAMKVLDKKQIIDEGAVRQCKDEAAIQSMAGDHPFVVKAHEYWQSQRNLYIVLDYIPHGDMFTLWTFHGAFPEDLVRLYIAEMAMVIDYLHNASVIYRDVKMENILFDPKGHIQLTDFGLAKWLKGGDQTRTVCGTLQYMAPEVLSVYPYSHAADWWSVGILMFAMLAGKYPVDGADTHTKMAQRVFESDYLLPSHISDSAQDVINRTLTKSPHKRLGGLHILQDLHFFQDVYLPDLFERKLNPVDVVPEDFFPMTGQSWAPHMLTPEEQGHFDQFDDSNDTITDVPDARADHYGRSHPNYSHDSLQQKPHQNSIHHQYNHTQSTSHHLHHPYPSPQYDDGGQRSPNKPQRYVDHGQINGASSLDRGHYAMAEAAGGGYVGAGYYSTSPDSNTYRSTEGESHLPNTNGYSSRASQVSSRGSRSNSSSNAVTPGYSEWTATDYADRQASSERYSQYGAVTSSSAHSPTHSSSNAIHSFSHSGQPPNSSGRINPGPSYKAVESPPILTLPASASGATPGFQPQGTRRPSDHDPRGQLAMMATNPFGHQDNVYKGMETPPTVTLQSPQGMHKPGLISPEHAPPMYPDRESSTNRSNLGLRNFDTGYARVEQASITLTAPPQVKAPVQPPATKKPIPAPRTILPKPRPSVQELALSMDMAYSSANVGLNSAGASGKPAVKPPDQLHTSKPPQALPSNPTRSRLTSHDSEGYSSHSGLGDAPLRSPSIDNGSLRWNLPPDAMPSFV